MIQEFRNALSAAFNNSPELCGAKPFEQAIPDIFRACMKHGTPEFAAYLERVVKAILAKNPYGPSIPLDVVATYVSVCGKLHIPEDKVSPCLLHFLTPAESRERCPANFLKNRTTLQGNVCVATLHYWMAQAAEIATSEDSVFGLRELQITYAKMLAYKVSTLEPDFLEALKALRPVFYQPHLIAENVAFHALVEAGQHHHWLRLRDEGVFSAVAKSSPYKGEMYISPLFYDVMMAL